MSAPKRPHQHRPLAFAGLLSAALMFSAACAVSPPAPPGQKRLVPEDAPVFDHRFRDVAREDLELSRFWEELRPRRPDERIAIDSLTYVDLVDRVRSGVVNLYTKVVQERRARLGVEPNQLLPFRIPVVSRIFDAIPFTVPIPFRSEGFALGSGFLINSRGFILTNAHVVWNATDIRVVRAGGRADVPAQIIGLDPVTDTALLRIDPQPGMTPLPLGDSDSLRVGEPVVAVGNPLGLQHTVTAGLISATERIVPGGFGVVEYLQTDTGINPGSSGGPLLNLRGEVVGINTAILGDAEAIGFAVPIAAAKAVMPLLIMGRSDRGWFGATARPAVRGLGIDLGSGRVVIDDVAEGSPAEAAGLRAGDLLTRLDGDEVTSFVALRRKLLPLLPGDEITLTVQRDGELLELRGRLSEAP